MYFTCIWPFCQLRSTSLHTRNKDLRPVKHRKNLHCARDSCAAPTVCDSLNFSGYACEWLISDKQDIRNTWALMLDNVHIRFSGRHARKKYPGNFGQNAINWQSLGNEGLHLVSLSTAETWHTWVQHSVVWPWRAQGGQPGGTWRNNERRHLLWVPAASSSPSTRC